MPSTAEFLRRFRFSGVPGAPAAVPIDRARALMDELRPVLAPLHAVETQATAAVARARDEAAGKRGEATAAAIRLLSEARARAAEERSHATALGLERANRLREEILATAEQEADRVIAVARSHMAGLVDEVVRTALSSSWEKS